MLTGNKVSSKMQLGGPATLTFIQQGGGREIHHCMHRRNTSLVIFHDLQKLSIIESLHCLFILQRNVCFSVKVNHGKQIFAIAQDLLHSFCSRQHLKICLAWDWHFWHTANKVVQTGFKLSVSATLGLRRTWLLSIWKHVTVSGLVNSEHCNSNCVSLLLKINLVLFYTA